MDATKLTKREQGQAQNDMIRDLRAMHNKLTFFALQCDKMADMGQAHRLTDNAITAIEAIANEVNGGDIFN